MSDKKSGRFSSYAILVPVEHRFKQEPILYWRFKPATSRDELKMTTFATTEGNYPGADGETIVRYPNIIEIAWREIALLYAGTNIPAQDIEPSKLEACKTQEDIDKLIAELPRLSNDATIDQVEDLLGSMPHQMVAELWEALGVANPGWGPRKEKKAS